MADEMVWLVWVWCGIGVLCFFVGVARLYGGGREGGR